MILPIYDKADIRVYRGDCLSVLPQLTDRPNLHLCDPPYSDSTHNNISLSYKPVTGQLMQGLLEFTRDHVERGRGVFFSDGDSLAIWHRAAEAAGLEWQHGVWVKLKPNHLARVKGVPPLGVEFMNFVLPPTGEDFFLRELTEGHGAGLIWESRSAGQWGGGVEERSPKRRDGSRMNPGRKPAYLICDLIKVLTNRGDLIIDATAGTGTTLVAAKLLGRHAIGIEMDEEQCEYMVQWLDRIDPFPSVGDFA